MENPSTGKGTATAVPSQHVSEPKALWMALFATAGARSATRMHMPGVVGTGDNRRINDEEPRRIVAAAPLFFLFLFDVASLTLFDSLSPILHNNSLHAQPSRGVLVISASQFVSNWSVAGRRTRGKTGGRRRRRRERKKQKKTAASRTKPPKNLSSLFLSGLFLLGPSLCSLETRRHNALASQSTAPASSLSSLSLSPSNSPLFLSARNPKNSRNNNNNNDNTRAPAKSGSRRR